jgi:hypothetical protein
MQATAPFERPFLQEFDRVHGAAYFPHAEWRVIDDNGLWERIGIALCPALDAASDGVMPPSRSQISMLPE